jgi:hypothetical protein
MATQIIKFQANDKSIHDTDREAEHRNSQLRLAKYMDDQIDSPNIDGESFAEAIDVNRSAVLKYLNETSNSNLRYIAFNGKQVAVGYDTIDIANQLYDLLQTHSVHVSECDATSKSNVTLEEMLGIIEFGVPFSFFRSLSEDEQEIVWVTSVQCS